MDPNDMLKAGEIVAKGAAGVGAAIPFTAIVKRMLGPAADEVAEMMRDKVRLYRYGRQLECVKKAEKMAEDAGFTPNAVPPKLLFPLLDGASFEEDENIHTMWAALLANASNPEKCRDVRPGYIALLRQMSPDEAAVLNWMCAEGLRKKLQKEIPQWTIWQLQEVYRGIRGIDTAYEDFEACLDSLEAASLIKREMFAVDDKPFAKFKTTVRGIVFFKACTPP